VRGPIVTREVEGGKAGRTKKIAGKGFGRLKGKLRRVEPERRPGRSISYYRGSSSTWRKRLLGGRVEIHQRSLTSLGTAFRKNP